MKFGADNYIAPRMDPNDLMKYRNIYLIDWHQFFLQTLMGPRRGILMNLVIPGHREVSCPSLSNNYRLSLNLKELLQDKW